MNKTQYRLMAQDVKENRANLAKYRKIFKYAYPFGDKAFTNETHIRHCWNKSSWRTRFG